MANLFKNPTHKAKIGYNGFDMSHFVDFSSSVGQLLPIAYDVLNPGDKVDISTVIKTRTNPIESSVNARLTEHVDYFFVPMEQIYRGFSAFYYGINDFNTSLMSESDPGTGMNQMPYILSPTLVAALSDNNARRVYFEEQQRGSWRLLDCLGVPVHRLMNYNSAGDVISQPMTLSPILPCAYQKIYYDYYRLSDRERNNPKAYNLDVYYNNPSITNVTTVQDMLQLHYAPWKRDFFTSTTPSPIYGAGDVSSFYYKEYNKFFNQWLTSTGVNILTPSGTQQNSGISSNVGTSASTIGVAATTSNITSAVNTAAIRTSFATEKLLEITRRAGKHYDSQTLAHFGVEVPTGIAGEVMYLGSQDSNIDFGDIYSTSDTTQVSDSGTVSGANIGQVGGQGFGYGKGRPVKFTAPSHGVFMAIYYCVPEVSYRQNGQDKLNNLIERGDWFTPEYDNLGMQPLFQYQSDINYGTRTSILGWQYRFSELKTKFNKAFGQIAVGNMRSWLPARDYFGQGDNLLNYLVNPRFLDDSMVMQYPTYFSYTEDNEEATYLELYDGDPLLHFFFVDYKKASKMSTYGLPSL